MRLFVWLLLLQTTRVIQGDEDVESKQAYPYPHHYYNPRPASVLVVNRGEGLSPGTTTTTPFPILVPSTTVTPVSTSTSSSSGGTATGISTILTDNNPIFIADIPRPPIVPQQQYYPHPPLQPYPQYQVPQQYPPQYQYPQQYPPLPPPEEQGQHLLAYLKHLYLNNLLVDFLYENEEHGTGFPLPQPTPVVHPPPPVLIQEGGYLPFSPHKPHKHKHHHHHFKPHKHKHKHKHKRPSWTYPWNYYWTPAATDEDESKEDDPSSNPYFPLGWWPSSSSSGGLPFVNPSTAAGDALQLSQLRERWNRFLEALKAIRNNNQGGIRPETLPASIPSNSGWDWASNPNLVNNGIPSSPSSIGTSSTSSSSEEDEDYEWKPIQGSQGAGVDLERLPGWNAPPLKNNNNSKFPSSSSSAFGFFGGGRERERRKRLRVRSGNNRWTSVIVTKRPTRRE